MIVFNETNLNFAAIKLCTMKKIFLLIASSALFLSTLTAGAENGKLYGSNDLTSSLTYCITQDSYGYIWIGTEHGLNRYDGYSFQHYFYDEADSTTITDNEISCMFHDSQNRLLIGTSRGLCMYDYKTNCFVRYVIPGLTPRIGTIIELNNGDIFIGTGGRGMFILPKGEQKISQVEYTKKYDDDDFSSRLFDDKNGDIWKGSHLSKVTQFKAQGRKLKRLNDYQLSCGPIVEFFETDNRGFFVVGQRGILFYDYARKSFIENYYDLSLLARDTRISSAMMTVRGDIIIGTTNRGLMIIRSGARQLEQMPLESNDIAISLANINYLFNDKDDNLWLSCYKEGVFHIATIIDVFHSYTTSEIPAELNSKLSVSDNLLQQMRSRYPDKDIKTAVADKFGNIYISQFGEGVLIYNPATQHEEVLSMFQTDRKGGYLTNNWVNTFYIDSKNMLWIGTSNGVSCMDIYDKTFNKYGWNEIVKEKPCNAISEDEHGNIVIGTNKGLFIYNRENNKVVRFPSSEQLQKLIICGIVRDGSGDFWFSTSKGIWRWSKIQKNFISYVNGNGLKSREYRTNAVYEFDDGTVGFGIRDGLTVFNPNEVKSNTSALSKVYLSNVTIGNKFVDCSSDYYKVGNNDGSMILEYSLFNFQNSENITFQYRINESDQWITIPEGSNRIFFDRVTPGKYEVEVRAICNGAYSTENSIITVRVTPPWYFSIWAMIAYILLAVAIIIFLVYFYDRKHRADMEEQKMQFLINATHDIRSPLTLILGPLKKLKERTTDPESRKDIDVIDKNAQRLLLLVNQILDERKIDKNQMRLHCEETKMNDFIGKICHLYEYNANERNIDFTYQCDDKDCVAWIDHTNFDKVVNNLISNAFKYTFDGGKISVKLAKEDNKIKLSITDTGIGLKSENPEKLFERFYQGSNISEYRMQGTGIGLNLSRAIVNMHGGTISAANREDGVRGSVFTIVLPEGNAHLKPEEIEETSLENESSDKLSNTENININQIENEQKVTISSTETEVIKPEKQTSSKAYRQIRILVADDDVEITDYISSELGKWYRFKAVSNGREALNELLSTRYDLIISDIMMPQMDGIELLKNIKGNTNISDIPVILLTSKSAISYRLEGLKKGADAYVAKPFDMEELHILIDNLVDNVRRLKGKFSGAQKQEDKMENVKVKGNNDALMERIMKCINKNLTDSDFNVAQLTEEVGISRAQLHRKMKEITGISTADFIRNLRLEQAARLLKEGEINITQIAYSVGFNNQTHFSTLFKKYYGKSPSEYASQFHDKHVG